MALFLTPCIAMADGRVLHIGSVSITLQTSCSTEHKLNVKIGNEIFCAPMTTTWSDNSLHVKLDDTVYTVCDGECGGGGSGYVMPETPPEPVELPTNCSWSQTNENAYLLSDGRQWFDTNVPVDTSVNISVTAKITNGHSARIFGTTSSTCYYDMTINANRVAFFKMGTSTSSTSVTLSVAQSTQKIRWYTETNNSKRKWIYRIFENGSSGKSNKDLGSACTSNDTIKVFNNNLVSTLDQTNSGGIKLYSIVLTNSSGATIHNYQPVAAGTNICGYTVPTNAMWDTVTKQVYLPAGTGQMGYGTD